MSYTLLVPASCETAITGLALAAERIVDDQIIRIEIHVPDPEPFIFRNGAYVLPKDATTFMKRFAGELMRYYADMKRLGGPAEIPHDLHLAGL